MKKKKLEKSLPAMHQRMLLRISNVTFHARALEGVAKS